MRAEPGAAYVEFNLSPSNQWAAYQFDGYRSGLTVAQGVELVELRQGEGVNDGRYGLTAMLDLEDRPGLPLNAPWHLGLSAVIEETNGAKSYWALAHAPGKPDFHHPDAFAHYLAAVEPA